MTHDDSRDIDQSQKTISFHPSLQAVVDEAGLDASGISVAVEVDNGRTNLGKREDILLSDGQKEATWTIGSLRELFRGERQAPEFGSGAPPSAYMPHFYFIEKHLLTYCEEFGDKTDQEFEKYFNDIRRRPDGASRDELHAYLWQVAALLAGQREVSAHEFEAIFNRLRRSARTFSIAPVSRNYVAVLRRL